MKVIRQKQQKHFEKEKAKEKEEEETKSDQSTQSKGKTVDQKAANDNCNLQANDAQKEKSTINHSALNTKNVSLENPLEQKERDDKTDLNRVEKEHEQASCDHSLENIRKLLAESSLSAQKEQLYPELAAGPSYEELDDQEPHVGEKVRTSARHEKLASEDVSVVKELEKETISSEDIIKQLCDLSKERLDAIQLFSGTAQTDPLYCLLRDYKIAVDNFSVAVSKFALQYNKCSELLNTLWIKYRKEFTVNVSCTECGKDETYKWFTSVLECMLIKSDAVERYVNERHPPNIASEFAALRRSFTEDYSAHSFYTSEAKALTENYISMFLKACIIFFLIFVISIYVFVFISFSFLFQFIFKYFSLFFFLFLFII